MPISKGDLDILKDFGAKLRKIRTDKKLSMQALANLAEVELSQIYRIEKGKINPKLTTIIILCKALEISPSLIIEV